MARWQVLGGATPGALAPVGLAPRSRFETAISAPAGLNYVAVRAQDATGGTLGTSPTVAVK